VSAAALAAHDVALICADNPGPLTLTGTNTWIVGRDPAWVIDPGPGLAEHRAAVLAAVAVRGGAGGLAPTHDHADHAEGAAALRAALGGVPLGAARGAVDAVLGDGDAFGPLTTLALPGHAPDHLVFLAGRVAFTGDAVLGEGSVFVAPGPGSLAGYLAGLARLRALAPVLLCPGHGPVVTDPAARLDELVAHREERERRLLTALAAGARTEEELLDEAWAEVPPELRPAAALTLRAHMGKLREEGRAP
jgi:glyoxylase-like metal-dependent hydrolase (beta-lactamase superfamily II)